MAEESDSLLDKAESFARRVLERMGARVDDRASASDQQTLSPREVGEITSKIEKAIEARLRKDDKGVKRVAPNIFKVLFPYEATSRLNISYIAALAAELRSTAFEYINNRRYETRGPVKVETGQDLFSKTTIVKAIFEGEQTSSEQARGSASSENPQSVTAARTINFATEDGQAYHVALKSEGTVYIGRAAGTALRIDDPSISRLHCSLALRQNGEVIISDLGSSNGTSVNDQLLDTNQGRALKEGDRVIVGDIVLKVAQIV
ncbi:MAG TPA: FHA domain-containing protein [Blastocatellia bacterium]|nr:FHA domain-containing protein [Blastocatellia bacterium]